MINTYKIDEYRIYEYKLSQDAISAVREHADYLKRSNLGSYENELATYDNRSGKKIYKYSNIGGFQSHKFSFNSVDGSHPLNGFFIEVNKVINKFLNTNVKYRIINYWTNSNENSDYNEAHNHVDSNPNAFTQAHLSGVFYGKVPKNSGNIVFFDNSLQNTLEVKSSEGNLLLFDSYLFHKVLPNRSKEERISLAFNATIVNSETISII